MAKLFSDNVVAAAYIISGKPGKDGKDGKDGEDGAPGEKGDPGEDGKDGTIENLNFSQIQGNPGDNAALVNYIETKISTMVAVGENQEF